MKKSKSVKKEVAIIGGGPSALLLAAFLDETRFDVTIYEQNKSVGRKFLVAGKGGFNLSHSEVIEDFIKRYTPISFLKKALLHFSNENLVAWLEQIGIPTYVGSSGRIFPIKGIKPIEVLNAILQVLKNKNVHFKYLHQWTGWTDQGDLIFNQTTNVSADYSIFALGGGSWKVTGSDGHWLALFKNKGIKTNAFLAANCAYQINWPKDFIQKNEGKPLKNIALIADQNIRKGEVVLTRFGMEGNAIYALSTPIQKALSEKGQATIFVDLKPSWTEKIVLEKLQNSKAKNTSAALRQDLKLSPTQIDLLKTYTSKSDFLDLKLLSQAVKQLPLIIQSAASVDKAISTMGGLDRSEVRTTFELKKLAGQYCIGEMLDWNAPTGGYLLQACFSMGVYLAEHLNSGF